MDLGEAVYREITGRSPYTEIDTWVGALEYLLTRGGGVASKAARLAGVPASTFRGWLRGRQPKPERAGGVFGEVSLIERRARLPLKRERRMRRPGALHNAKISGTYGYQTSTGFTPSSAGWTGGGGRDANIGPYMVDGTQDDVLDAYLEGASLDELAELFADGIGDNGWYARTFNPDSTDSDGWDIDSLDGWA